MKTKNKNLWIVLDREDIGHNAENEDKNKIILPCVDNNDKEIKNFLNQLSNMMDLVNLLNRISYN